MALILLVEDKQHLIDAYVPLLEAAGYDVDVATSGLDAIKMMRERTPDLVLLDYELPKYDGLGTLRRIRNNSAWRNVPVIFLTIRIMSQIMHQGLKSGAKAFIVKPLVPTDLLDELNLVLDTHYLLPLKTEEKVEISINI